MLCRLELVLHAILMLFSLSRSELFESKKERAENSFRKKVEAVYRKVTPCLQLTSTFNSQQMAYNDDLEDHYGEILAVTGQYRGLKPHTGSGNYSGPWIENLFIRDFIKRPFKYFNGIIPLFVQWSDYHLHFKSEINKDTNNRFTEEEIFRNVTSILRKNVLYMVISQANYGIRFLTTSHPNILIFSAGGEGDIPIPLIKGELAFRETDRGTFPKIDVGFYGTIDHGHRKKSLDSLSALLKSSPYSYRMGPSRTWIDDMAGTMFNLAPMGMGRASFRLAEIIQTGRIPIYLYGDYPWLPYHQTGFGPGEIGYLVQADKAVDVMAIVTSATNQSTDSMMKRVRAARELYTYAGLLEQIEKWFRDPFGPRGGFLRCHIKDRKSAFVEAISPL